MSRTADLLAQHDSTLLRVAAALEPSVVGPTVAGSDIDRRRVDRRAAPERLSYELLVSEAAQAGITLDGRLYAKISLAYAALAFGAYAAATFGGLAGVAALAAPVLAYLAAKI